MKKTILSFVVVLFMTTGVRAQSSGKSAVKVIHADSANKRFPNYLVNGELMHQATVATLDPMQIASIDVIKDSAFSDHRGHSGTIIIKMKSGYDPRLITLLELKKKYASLTTKPAIFMIDNNFINGDPAQCRVDENNLLSITIDSANTTQGTLDIAVIRLLTRSAKNIKEAEIIRLR
jgi:pimeloyl-CoA synthetase